jgi:lysozyme
MPVRKKATSTNKYFKWIAFFLACLLIFSFYVKYKNQLAYYFGFTTKGSTLTAKQRMLEDVRIADIVKRHEGKIFGIDVSQYQGNIDFSELEASKELFELKFVIVRATAGASKVDYKFKRNWSKLLETQYFQGAYHYYRPDENSTEQAENFIETVKLQKGQLPPILDIEAMPKGQSMKKLKEGLQNWLNLVENHYGIKPIIYTGEKYYDSFLKDDFPDYQFWIANYNPWKENLNSDYLMWQFSEKGKMIGIDYLVDINVFNGNVNDMKEICID